MDVLLKKLKLAANNWKLEKSWLDLFLILLVFYFIRLNLLFMISFEDLFGDKAIAPSIVKGYYNGEFYSHLCFENSLVYRFLLYLNIICAGAVIFCKKKSIPLFLVWLGLFLVFIRIPLVKSIHIEYIGWMLIYLSTYYFLIRESNLPEVRRRAPAHIFLWGAWIFFTITYVTSGIFKASTSEWADGVAIKYVVQTAIARDTFLYHWVQDKGVILKFANYYVVLLEIFCVFFLFHRTGRLALWTLSLLFHLTNFVFLRINELTYGMVIFHFFILAMEFETSTKSNFSHITKWPWPRLAPANQATE